MGVFSVSCPVCVCVCVYAWVQSVQSYAAVFFLAEFWFGETQRVIFLYVQRHIGLE